MKINLVWLAPFVLPFLIAGTIKLLVAFVGGYLDGFGMFMTVALSIVVGGLFGVALIDYGAKIEVELPSKQ